MRESPSDDDVRIEFNANDVAFVPPLDTGRVPEILESVVVATQLGIPFARARTKPLVETGSSVIDPADAPYSSSPVPIAPPAKLLPSIVPVQSPVALSVRAPPDSCNPVPKRLLNDEPLMMRLVVLAVANEE